MDDMINEDVNVGIHPYAKEKVDLLFSNTQKEIVQIFKKFWYITKAENRKIGASVYNYLLIKAPVNIWRLFQVLCKQKN